MEKVKKYGKFWFVTEIVEPKELSGDFDGVRSRKFRIYTDKKLPKKYRPK